jgi:hypothetical protein
MGVGRVVRVMVLRGLAGGGDGVEAEGGGVGEQVLFFFKLISKQHTIRFTKTRCQSATMITCIVYIQVDVARLDTRRRSFGFVE